MAGKYDGSDTPTLSIKNVDDSDAAVYQCIAENRQGTAHSSLITITVTVGKTYIKSMYLVHQSWNQYICNFDNQIQFVKITLSR